MKKRSRLLLAALLTLLLLLSVSGYWAVYHVLPYSPIAPRRFSQSEVIARLSARGSPDSLFSGVKPFSVMTADSVRLAGLFLPAKGTSRGTVIFLHGISSYKETRLRQAQALAREGFNCAVYDSRAHGESGGAYCTFGFYEKKDVSVVIDTLLRKFGPVGPFALSGNSLGAAVAVQTLPLEPRIVCAVVQAPFATLREVVYDYQVRLYHLPFRWVTNAALGESERIAHFVADSVSPERAASVALQPVLVIHGTADDEISIAHGRRVFAQLRSPGKEFFELPGGDHGSLGLVTREEYDRRIVAFLREHLR
jgi:dipeptidyl aminopeptidase/acylaminoacyl peptidase